MNDAERARFDELVEEAIESLPAEVRELIDRVPVVVSDRPGPELIRELRAHGVIPADADPSEDHLLCGLHSGWANTEKTVEASGELPPRIDLFREGIIDLALGEDWGEDRAENGEEVGDAEDRILEEIRITLLHEIGHQFGLDEDDLDRLGYA